MPLTAKQARFVAEYQVDRNATQAAIRAGYSRHTAHVQGSRLLKKVEAQQTLVKRDAAVLSRVEITAEAIAREAWSIATDPENGPGPRVAALALLARRHPEFSEKHDVKVDASLRVEAMQAVTTLTPDEMKALAARARA